MPSSRAPRRASTLPEAKHHGRSMMQLPYVKHSGALPKREGLLRANGAAATSRARRAVYAKGRANAQRRNASAIAGPGWYEKHNEGSRHLLRGRGDGFSPGAERDTAIAAWKPGRYGDGIGMLPVRSTAERASLDRVSKGKGPPEPHDRLRTMRHRLPWRSRGRRSNWTRRPSPIGHGAPSPRASTGKRASTATSRIPTPVPTNRRSSDKSAAPRGGFSWERICGTTFSN